MWPVWRPNCEEEEKLSFEKASNLALKKKFDDALDRANKAELVEANALKVVADNKMIDWQKELEKYKKKKIKS